MLNQRLYILARHPHVIAMSMDIDDLAHALDHAFAHAYPGREAVARCDVMRVAASARRARARADLTAPGPRLSDPLRGASGFFLLNALRLL
jgi:hypothetical protein